MIKRKGNSPVAGEQLVIPIDVDLTFQTGVKKKAFEGTKSADLYRPLIEKIRVIDGFNPRIKTRKYRLGIEKLARDMVRSGFDETQTLTVFLIYENEHHIICLHDGHRRLEAVFLANQYLAAEGKPRIERVPVTITEKNDSKSLNIGVVRRNDKEPLTVLEKAILARRLNTVDGMSPEEIAVEMQDSEGELTPYYIEGLLLLAGAERGIHEIVAEDKISGTEAIKQIRKHKANALSFLQRATDGKEHVRPRDLPGALVKRVTKKIAPRLVTAVRELEADPAYDQLKEETRLKIKDLMDRLSDAEKKDPPLTEDNPGATSAANPEATGKAKK
ncbi:hypothetical protein [Paraburkholderia humisilvae]|uniref:ParB/Sulfiredoxin domain-containing protein n=1 Tax=Paraburkholderia humisilvae TaxID=627669 RepID=A0A6J5DJE4_9BURK|nr:hypothetical protein [Paraburkholderia humisilvae]CAB3754269.1 hypothetical protein LMG29542_02297 [Paraburkholderia humisilvae]